jgi:hypothetical protein
MEQFGVRQNRIVAKLAFDNVNLTLDPHDGERRRLVLTSLHLATRYGGAGVTSLDLTSLHIAFLGGVVSTLATQDAGFWDRPFDERLAALKADPDAAAALAFLEAKFGPSDLRTKAGLADFSVSAELLTPPPPPAGGRRREPTGHRALADALHRLRCEGCIELEPDPAMQSVRRSNCGHESALFIGHRHSFEGQLDNSAFDHCFLLRLGAGVSVPDRECPLCKRPDVFTLAHALVCPSTQPKRSTRHSGVSNAFSSVVTSCKNLAGVQQYAGHQDYSNLGWQRRAGVSGRIRYPDRTLIIDGVVRPIDFNITGPVLAVQTAAARKPGVLAEYGARVKREQLLAHYDITAATLKKHFVPAIFEATGAWGTPISEFLADIIHREPCPEYELGPGRTAVAQAAPFYARLILKAKETVTAAVLRGSAQVVGQWLQRSRASPQGTLVAA